MNYGKDWPAPVPYPPKRQAERDWFINHVKGFVDVMDAEQLKEIRDYADGKLLGMLRGAAEGMVAAFDERPPGEDPEVTRITRESALNVAKEDLGWGPRGEEDEDVSTRTAPDTAV